MQKTILAVTIVLMTAASFSLAQSNDTGVAGMINVGPVPVSSSALSGSKPLANVTFVVKNETTEVASFTTDGDGRFQISLAPGHYRVSRKDAQPKVGRYGPFDVDVVAGQITNVTWSCDSGMR